MNNSEHQPDQVLVCSACRTESCWEGVFMCEDAAIAGTSVLIPSVLPLGFRHVNVTVTAAEHRALRKEATLLATGNVGTALRKRAGLPEEPHGLKAARARQTVNRKN